MNGYLALMAVLAIPMLLFLAIRIVPGAELATRPRLAATASVLAVVVMMVFVLATILI